ncbi:MAG: hypothetical protein RL385_1129 [Pseudomonadota bacterium]
MLMLSVTLHARAAPQPALVRFTNISTAHYANHGGGNLSSVTASATAPVEASTSNLPLVSEGPDMWRLVDWNGGLLMSGDSVSFAVRMENEPYYLRASSCDHGSMPHTKKRATVGSGLTNADVFTLHAVTLSILCSPSVGGQPFACSLVPNLAPAGTVIGNGTTFAIETQQGCFLYETGAETLMSDGTLAARGLRAVWNLWYKVVPRSDDDFPGHADTCFGGVGEACWNNPSLWYLSGTNVWRTEAADDDGGKHTFKRIDVSVGSISHDNCCLRNPTGKVCGGVFTGTTEMKNGTRPGRGVMAVSALRGGEVWQGTRCEWEWQRALDGTSLFNTWTHEFGPYYSDDTHACPGCLTAGERAWGLNSDRLFRRTTSRQALLLNGTWKRWIADMPSHYPGGSNEVDNTTALSAPAVTHIYPNGFYSREDVLGDFCSKRTAYWDAWSTAWVCAEIECTSGVAHWDVFGSRWACD